MRIGIVGAGGVGGLAAGLLARAGHDVAVVARGATADAIRARGVRVDSPLGSFDARVELVDARDLDTEVVLVAVKTWQVADAARSLGRAALVVPLENGVDAADECVDALGAERVAGGLCHMLSWIAEPGSVKHVGAPPRFTFGAWRTRLAGRLDSLVSALSGAGADAKIVDDFPAALWEKFLFIASFGGVGAVTRATAAELRGIPETRAMLVAAFEEVGAVAAAKGVALPSDVVARTVAYVDALPADATASLQRDVVAGRPSEIASLSGAVARVGVELGVATPVHAAIYAALLPMERAARSER